MTADEQSRTVLHKKICMLGAVAVGKTSLVRHYVTGIFSDRYQATVGVKIDKKVIDLGNKSVVLLLWDLAGVPDYETLRASYLRGASGFLLVVDGTRGITLDLALDINAQLGEDFPGIPLILVLNKHDLEESWNISDEQLAGLEQRGMRFIFSSAKTGHLVEETFVQLATLMTESGKPAER